MNAPLPPPLPEPLSDRRTGVWRHLREAQQRERAQLVAELSQIRGLMPLLMKRRNGESWTRDERRDLVGQLRAVMHLSPYLVVLALPGSFVLLPLLAWWLDRRRLRRRPMAQA